MKVKKADMYRADREKGMTYKEIAEKYGVATQTVGIACGKHNPKHFHYVNPKNCIYINLRNWLNEGKISRMELLRRMGYEALPKNYNALSNYISGKSDPSKHVIDAMIKATGFTYEELFMEG